MSDVTVTNEPPQPNTSEARTPDGTLRDVSTLSSTPTQNDQTTDSSTEGESFLTGKKTDSAAGDKTDPAASDADKSKTPDKKDDAPVGAPEKYADFKLPDGYKFDAPQLEKAQALFKENNLTQEQAQKLVDYYAENSLQAAKAPYEAWAKLQKDWSSEIASRFPGEASNTVRTNINRAIDAVLPPSLARNFRAALDLTGAGTHPDLVEGLSLLFRPHYEGTPVRGNGPSADSQKSPGQGGPISHADAIYPHLRK